MIAGDYFITPHAVHQFQTRIAPWMTYEQALAAIIHELRGAGEPRPTMNGKAYYVRTNGEWQFRAVIREGEIQPAVITILRSGKGKKRNGRTGDRIIKETASKQAWGNGKNIEDCGTIEPLLDKGLKGHNRSSRRSVD
jgi:hypothetical protein